MKALATGRRHRLAPVALMTLALLFTGVVYAALAPAPAQAETPTASDIQTGERLFLTNCSTCHGMNAQGTDDGPSLIGVGAAAVHFQVSTGRMPMGGSSPQAQEKPPQFDDEEIMQLSAYVASLGAGPEIPSDEQVDPATGDAMAGSKLFLTNCAMCHNAAGAGGALSNGKSAPPLDDATPTQIYEAMLTGPQSMPVFNNANLTPDEKRDIVTYLMEQRDPAPGGFSLGSIGPVSEGLWAFAVGMGLLIGLAVWIGARSS